MLPTGEGLENIPQQIARLLHAADGAFPSHTLGGATLHGVTVIDLEELSTTMWHSEGCMAGRSQPPQSQVFLMKKMISINTFS